MNIESEVAEVPGICCCCLGGALEEPRCWFDWRLFAFCDYIVDGVG